MKGDLIGHAIKRSLDIVGAAIILIVLSPLLAVISLSILLVMGRPIVFRQQRPGRNGKSFLMTKFRTMREAFDSRGVPLTDGERVTRLGFVLRSTSLDELPELLNVIRGEMSLVGPRPLLMDYLTRYSPEQNRRHEVRPGITGLAQISGRQQLTFGRRLELDVWYVDHWSVWLDLKILLRTMPSVVSSRGVITGQDLADVDDVGLSAGSPVPVSQRNHQ